MQIPEYFRKRIVSCFGTKGIEWLKHLPLTFSMCIKKWNLTDCNFAKNLSVNLVCYAKSSDFGDVVLKMGVPHRELYTEMKTLSLFKGQNICTCYDSDEEIGAILLERIIPGIDLTTLSSKKQQLKVASELIVKLPIPVEDDYGFPTYTDWVNRAFERARTENKVGVKMFSLIDTAEKLFAELEYETTDRPRVLLHGDLHHWNILQDQDGQWKAIDPHGVIGIPCMESARFMNNHIDVVPDIEKLDHLDEMVSVFSSKFGETKRIITICLFVLFVLSTCWTFEENDPDPTRLLSSINNCEIILDYLKTI